VNNGDTVTVRLTSSGSYSTTVNATLTISGVSETFSVTTVADSTGPFLSITSHSNNQHVSSSSMTLCGTASDSGSGDNGIQQVTVNGNRGANDTASGSGTANWSKVVMLSEGTNMITAVAYDDSSNHNTTTQNLTIYYDLPDTTPPSLAITSHTNNQDVNTSSITLSGTASDSGKGNNGIQKVTVNGVEASNGTATGNGTASWSQVVSLSPGVNTLTVIAYDNSSNYNPTSQTITIYYDLINTIYVSRVGVCNGHSHCWPNIQDGIVSASAPSLIKITQETYNENIVLDFNEEITLLGGWDANFTSNASYTTINGSITIKHGTMIIEKIIIQ
jgi:hypothetical protein